MKCSVVQRKLCSSEYIVCASYMAVTYEPINFEHICKQEKNRNEMIFTIMWVGIQMDQIQPGIATLSQAAYK